MGRPFGVYVHFPWCTHRCPYCDFAVTTGPQPGERRYARAVLAELALRAAAFDGLAPGSVGRARRARRRARALPDPRGGRGDDRGEPRVLRPRAAPRLARGG